jgi:hypothetical protein
MAKRGNLSLVIFAVLILAVAMYLTGNLTPSQGESQAGISIVVNYEDGSTRVIDSPNTLSIFNSINIIDSTGKNVQSLDYHVKVRAYFSGDPIEFDYANSQVDILIDQSLKSRIGETDFIGHLENGVWTTVLSRTITKDKLEYWSQSHGDHVLVIQPMVSLVITWGDGTVIGPRSAIYDAEWNYTFEPDGDFTGLSITVETVPLI